MSDILLIQPPIRDFYLTTKRTIPYGLACIASTLQKSGFSVDIFDGLASSKSKVIDLPEEMKYLEELYKQADTSPIGLFYDFRHYGYSFEHIGTVARKSGAFLIGISSLFTPYANEALKTAETIKRFHPHCKIVLGGHHPTAMPSHVMECKAVDFVLRGEGEVSMPLLAEALKNDLPLEQIPGIVFRKKDQTLHVNSPAIMKNPDDYPLPALELIKHRYYRRAGKGSAVITASRGCPMKCSYCSVSATSYLTYRRRSIPNVLNEIEIA
ncbi:cobalamin-dependent protein, partial [bacterium]|nr:cobalamin-dependent protein [bacterium]